MEQNKREQWIEAVLNSTKGMQHAEVNPYLFEKIQNKISQKGKVMQLIPYGKVAAVAACLALLIVSNILVFSNQENVSTQNEISTVAEYYQLNNSSTLQY